MFYRFGVCMCGEEESGIPASSSSLKARAYICAKSRAFLCVHTIHTHTQFEAWGAVLASCERMKRTRGCLLKLRGPKAFHMHHTTPMRYTLSPQCVIVPRRQRASAAGNCKCAAKMSLSYIIKHYMLYTYTAL